MWRAVGWRNRGGTGCLLNVRHDGCMSCSKVGLQVLVYREFEGPGAWWISKVRLLFSGVVEVFDRVSPP